MTTFVTAIYNGLYGTEYGGRQRKVQYFYSLLSLMKMTDANFVIFTSPGELEELSAFLLKQKGKRQIFPEYVVVGSDINAHSYRSEFLKYKNIDEMKKSDRCQEVIYEKHHFVRRAMDIFNSDCYFWIDAGLSYSGLIPDKYLDINGDSHDKYYSSPLFNNVMLRSLERKANAGTIFGIVKENKKEFWSATLPKEYYNGHYNADEHFIAGLWGGKKDVLLNYIKRKHELIKLVFSREKKIFGIELFMSCIYARERNLFNVDKFDVWLHEDNYIGQEPKGKYFKNKKSFYNVLEELNV